VKLGGKLSELLFFFDVVTLVKSAAAVGTHVYIRLM